MSLINCPQCGKIVSDKAIRCPHCKRELKPITDAPKEERESKVVAQSDVKTTQSQSCPTPNIVDSYKWLFAIFVIVVVLVVACIGYLIGQEPHTEDDTMGVTTSGESGETEKSSDFVTLDLSAFLLHGHVKKVTESDGRMICFDYNGKISHYNDDWIDLSDEQFNVKYDKEYDKDIFRIAGIGSGKEFQIDKINRLTTIHIWMGNSYEAEKKFSDYDKNGLPTKWKIVENYQEREEGEEDLPMSDIWKQRAITTTIKYSDIDEYGNWRVKTETDNEGNTSTIHRNIEYY